MIEFRVIEHFDNDPPEPFGFVRLESEPVLGSTVRLKWLDGRDAYDVRVDRVDNFTLHVRAVAGRPLRQASTAEKRKP